MTMSDKPTAEGSSPASGASPGARQGALRIYIGAFPGVGKTYAMLSEAHRRQLYNEDVVVGYVETHGRRDIEELTKGLEIVPRKRVEYQGVAIEEMDVDAILQRKPVVCMVDELAHTNAPGSPREKRYEDVDVIRAAGIDVVSTLNIQHLESLNDTVELLTGVRVRETIPDSVVDTADELILIDLSPEAARARMEHGHIYPTAQAEVALQRFFKVENLAALRGLVLRRTSLEVDQQLDEYMRLSTHTPLGIDEHVLVLMDDTLHSRKLIRRGWHVAKGLRADLIVAYLRRDRDEKAQAQLAGTIELAEDLSARVMPLEGDDEESALATLIKAEGINHLVLPHIRRGAMARLTQRSLADRLMIAVPWLDVHLVGAE